MSHVAMPSRRVLALLVAGVLTLGTIACEQAPNPVSPRPQRAAADVAAQGAAPYYYFDGKPVYLAVDPTRLVVTTSLTSTAAVHQAAAGVLAGVGVPLADSAQRLGPPPHHWLLRLPAGTPPALASAARGRLQHDARFKFVSHAYKTVEGNHDVMLLDHVVVRFKSGVSQEAVTTRVAALGSRILRPPVPDSGYVTYILGAPADSTMDVLTLANTLQNDPSVAWASPDFISDWHVMSVPSDPFYPLQYYLKNLLTYNGVPADINIEPAWDLTKGSSSIRIIFIDTGIDAWHPEWAARNGSFVGFDALWYLPNQQPGEWTGHPYTGDSHGTSVAGIALAAHDGVGTAGIAPNVLFDAVRIFRGGVPAAANDVANGITWAYQRSDVLNNSWGGGSYSQVIADAVANALRYGRSGKGSVVVFSVGNDNGPQTWQSQLPGVVAVAALARTGLRASYSNTGSSITVSAFGGELHGNTCFGADIVTTDLAYPHPCNDGPNGDSRYTSSFCCTSAAAPQVSGVAALLLSREPSLTAAQVKARIRTTADYWGAYSDFGYGKLNAYRALIDLENLQLTMGGPSYIDTPGTYSWSANVTGGTGVYSYLWQQSVNNGSTWYTVGTNSPTYSTSIQSNGNFQLKVTVSSNGVPPASQIKNIAVNLSGSCNPYC